MTTPNESPFPSTPPPASPPPIPIAGVSTDPAKPSGLTQALEGLARPTRLAFLGIGTLVGLRIARSVGQSSPAWGVFEGGAAALALISAGEILARLWGVLARWTLEPRARGTEAFASGSPRVAVVGGGNVAASSPPVSPSGSPTAPISPAETATESPRLVRIERALETRDWALVARELAEWRADPTLADPPATLLARWQAIRQTEARRLLGRIEAARQARDLEGVLEDRRALEPLVDPDEQARLTRDLAGWVLRTFQERLRGGLFSAETALLAARLAEEFAETPEGASLRAALPTLRRAAKLCPRCAGPYDGVEDCCPRCLSHELGGSVVAPEQTNAASSTPPPPPPTPPAATMNGQVSPGATPLAWGPPDGDLPPLTRNSEEESYFLDPDDDADAAEEGEGRP